MLTIKQIENDKEAIIKGLNKKHFVGAEEAIDRVIELDQIRKKAQVQLDNLLNQTKVASKNIGMLLKNGQ